MTRRALAACGAVVCIAWAVLTAWAFVHGAMRRDDDVPSRESDDDVQPWDSRTVVLADGVSVTVSSGEQTTTSSAEASGIRWQN